MRYTYPAAKNRKGKNLRNFYPVAIRIKGRPAVVIGGGLIAERKIVSLLGAGAQVKVVSPNLTQKLRGMAERKQLSWRRWQARREDLTEAGIIIAATNDRQVNRNIRAWARQGEVLVNIVDHPALSDFISPAVFNKREAIIAVFTDGRNPALSRDLKNFLKGRWDEFLSFRNRLQQG